ncbi:MAG: serine protease [Chloroflexota bacterium]|nr:serine protease [Chloroflexota bacterium]
MWVLPLAVAVFFWPTVLILLYRQQVAEFLANRSVVQLVFAWLFGIPFTLLAISAVSFVVYVPAAIIVRLARKFRLTRDLVAVASLLGGLIIGVYCIFVLVAAFSGGSSGVAQSVQVPYAGQDPTLKLLPSLVEVTAESPSGLMTGSGFIVDASSTSTYILTATHVVADADAIRVTFRDGTSKTGRWAAKSSTGDVSLLRTQVVAFPSIPVSHDIYSELSTSAGSGDVPPSVYEVVALGMVDGAYLTRFGTTTAVTMDSAGWVNLETTAPVEPGMSGGPVVNRCGNLAAITSLETSRASARGVALALDPRLVEDLKSFAATPTPTPTAWPTATPTSTPTPWPTPTPTWTPTPWPTPTPTRTPWPTPTWTPTPRPTPTPTRVKNLSSWWIYTNTVYRYSIDIPPSWELDNTDRTNVYVVIPASSPGWYFAQLNVFAMPQSGQSVESLASNVLSFRQGQAKELFELVSPPTQFWLNSWPASRFEYRAKTSPDGCVMRVVETTVSVPLTDWLRAANFDIFGWACEGSWSRYGSDIVTMQNGFRPAAP